MGLPGPEATGAKNAASRVAQMSTRASIKLFQSTFAHADEIVRIDLLSCMSPIVARNGHAGAVQ